ncbi:putative lytic transglycosylase, catalytic [Escherichia coli]|nr:putative lytic transglycosylase, catalytic [Escherichia coli]
MNAETIKDFLVSLGFSVDDAGAKKFGSVLAGTTANVIKMGLAVEGAALSVVAFTAKIASGLDNLLLGVTAHRRDSPGNSVYWLCGFAGWRQRGRCAIFSGKPIPVYS